MGEALYSAARPQVAQAQETSQTNSKCKPLLTVFKFMYWTTDFASNAVETIGLPSYEGSTHVKESCSRESVQI